MENEELNPQNASAGTIPEYMKSRVDSQIDWYNRKAGTLKRRYRWLKICTITMGGLIPVAIAFSDFLPLTKYLAAVFGAAISILEGISGMLRDKETLTEYRAAAEALIAEKMQFQSGAGKYAAATKPFLLFVDTCETIMGAETSKWVAVSSNQDKKQDQPNG